MNHELGAPERMSYPGGKDGMYRVRCSCGYITSPYPYPDHAERAAATHKRGQGSGRPMSRGKVCAREGATKPHLGTNRCQPLRSMH